MVTEERTIALAMAEHLVNELKDMPEARTLWVSASAGETTLWLVTDPFDPLQNMPLYDAAVTLYDVFPNHAWDFHVLNPIEFDTDDTDRLFRHVIPNDAVEFEIHTL